MGLFSGLFGKGADETLDVSTAIMIPMARLSITSSSRA